VRGVVLLLAAGDGTRLGCGPKGFVDLRGRPLLRWAADAAAGASLVDSIVVAVRAGAEADAKRSLDGLAAPIEVVAGGDTRQASCARALEAAADAPAVIVHDAARALCPSELFDRCLEAVDVHEAVLCGVPVSDTIKAVDGDVVRETLDRARFVRAQTPQAFRTALFREAHASASRYGFQATDDVALVERLGVAVHVVPGAERNIKITTPEDLRIADALLG
jgi:2-C-methyl-D-erythritol 4-phosphate cytidylyltransferase